MADRGRQLLDLSTLVERDFIKIDGSKYELRSIDELTLLDYNRIGSLGQGLEPLFAAGLTGVRPEDWDDLVTKLDLLLGMILIAPAEIRSKLNETQKASIVTAFTTLLAEKTRKATPAGAEEEVVEVEPIEATSTGESISPV